jgi:hypothetical protein
MADYLDAALCKYSCKELRGLIKETLPSIKGLDKIKKINLIEIIMEHEDEFLIKLGIPVKDPEIEEKPIIENKEPNFKNQYSMLFITGCKRKAEHIYNLPKPLHRMKLKNSNDLINYFYTRIKEGLED